MQAMQQFWDIRIFSKLGLDEKSILNIYSVFYFVCLKVWGSLRKYYTSNNANSYLIK